MRSTDNVFIYDWMIEDLQLSASGVIIYAIIHNINWNTGKLCVCTIQDLANSTGRSYVSAKNILNHLIERGLIKRRKYKKYGVTFTGYAVNLEYVPDNHPKINGYIKPDLTISCHNHKVVDNERRKYKYTKWREEALKKDGYKCKLCGSNKFLHVHHIKSYSKYPELRLEISNGITLCEQCHAEWHRGNRGGHEGYQLY